MLQLLPAEPGMPVDEIDTPSLVVDLDAFEFNLDTMARLAAAAGVRVRPHAKTHKSPVVAHLQMARGAVGQCVQKIAEAEVLAWGGVTNILVSNEVVSPRKLARLAALTRICTVAVCADSSRGVALIETAAKDADVRITVLVEIDVGAGRCGVAPGWKAVALARQIVDSPHLNFGGLQAYHGAAQHQRTPEQRAASIAAAARLTARVVEDLKHLGIECSIVGGAGTGTFELEAASGVYNELQVGSYVFMDADYGRNKPALPFQNALFVRATVMSAPHAGLAVIDAGHKAVAVDSGLPLVWQRPGITYVGASDEHGNLALAADAVPLRIGEHVMLVPGHCDPTVDRYDWYVGVRNGRVERMWPVAGRGAMS
ncbi:DSD1 family PLP-dependent enzyme [Lichenihabitans psoromatis]|uniref:DSD1 family PLP-dependent enzyme n=1 Tax=Lichenihabitans psoromatis TaxID=2528642 RepID=UPI001A94CDB2|nr:DSD1 family PLP-dependent enzyme [Lichenihabitans psoromatis]